jgi:tyrosyl-tRNA synthetase
VSYVSPKPPAELADVEARAAYLLEDGFVDWPAGSLVEKLRQKDHLRVKFGVDPTAASVTWGWSVPLRRLRRFQELGHTAVLIIGDYTAQVGDPSGRSQTRRRLDKDEVEGYIRACTAALLEILSPDRLEVRRNSEWLGAMDMKDVLALRNRI